MADFAQVVLGGGQRSRVVACFPVAGSGSHCSGLVRRGSPDSAIKAREAWGGSRLVLAGLVRS